MLAHPSHVRARSAAFIPAEWTQTFTPTSSRARQDYPAIMSWRAHISASMKSGFLKLGYFGNCELVNTHEVEPRHEGNVKSSEVPP